MPRLDLRLIRSLVKRDLRMYFTNPSGYVFITLFILLSAAAAFWQDRFFRSNLANFDGLNELFPYLLLFFVPALTMGAWSEERRQGTDELLLTLPATDLEVVLGKYLASLGVYSASLVLSLSHVLVLVWLGSPDPGLLAANYLGYWLLGAALIAAGLLASLLSANPTVAFILGTLLCSAFVLIEPAVSLLNPDLGRLLGAGSVVRNFEDLARGVVSLRSLAYFGSLGGFLLYLNVLLLGRRHWPREADGWRMGAHHLVRAAAVALALVSANAMLARASLRADLTAEGLHTLSPETRKLLRGLEPRHPVFVQAYVSPAVPEMYVQTRANLLAGLAEMKAQAGPALQVLVEDTEPFSDAARSARERFDITPRSVPNLAGARAGFTEVFLGIAFTSGANEQVIPFLDRGLPVEYELARAIRVVARAERKSIGVVGSELQLFGGLDFQTFRHNPPWSVVEELKKQYEVVQVSPASPITSQVDGLLVVLPSSLGQEELDNVAAFVEAGHPALILDDPLPIVDTGLAASERPGAGRNPFLNRGLPPPKPKGDIEAFLARFGLRWNKAAVVWDTFNPHPDLAHLPAEVVFVARGSGAESPFNPREPATSALQELVLLYPGSVEPQPGSPNRFDPLLVSGRSSGENDYGLMVRRGLFGSTLNPRPPRRTSGRERVLAARVQGPDGGAGARRPIDVAFVPDVDFISEQFFAIRRAAPPNLNFDNVTFFLNLMDELAGDRSFLELRSRRVAHRTLTRVEDRTREFIERRAREEKDAEAEAEKALADAQKRLTARVQELKERTDLDAQTKQIMARNLEEVENRRLDVLKAGIQAAKEAKVLRSKEDLETQVRRIQSGIRTSAVLLPPIPVFALGVLIFIRRERRERAGAAAARRLRS